MKTDLKIGQAVKAARKIAKFSQIELAQILGINQSALCRIENGIQKLSASEALVLREIIGFKLEEVFK